MGQFILIAGELRTTQRAWLRKTFGCNVELPVTTPPSILTVDNPGITVALQIPDYVKVTDINDLYDSYVRDHPETRSRTNLAVRARGRVISMNRRKKAAPHEQEKINRVYESLMTIRNQVEDIYKDSIARSIGTYTLDFNEGLMLFHVETACD